MIFHFDSNTALSSYFYATLAAELITGTLP